MDRIEEEKIIVSLVITEVKEILKFQKDRSDLQQWLSNYLFQRLPQLFAAQQLPLYSISIIRYDSLYELTVNFRTIARIG